MRQKSSYTVADFSPHLFWDVDVSNLDWQRNKSQIVKRVLEYGLLNDWILLKRYYGIEQIGQIGQTLRSLDGRALSFISNLSGIPKEFFRCYTLKQSTHRPWNF